MDQYVIYLRKSRVDIEAEAYGDEDTLARHEKALVALANRHNLNVTAIYPEIVSGETIEERPYMKRLLKEVESGMWSGVLVMEVERLARGDTRDQGLVAQTFKYSSTKIYTPMKIYDPDNEYDEEYFEFGLYMSRREYKTINRRLQRGRIASVSEGKYVGNKAPYGYMRKKLERTKGFTLEPHPEEADVVKLIYHLFTCGEIQPGGTYQRYNLSSIARYLNNIGIKPRISDAWVTSSIRLILTNPVYYGMIRWQRRPQNKQMVNSKIQKSRPINNDYILKKGLHEAIIDENTFTLAQSLLKEKSSAPINHKRNMQNPLAGLIICGKCGRVMLRKIHKNSQTAIACTAPHCTNVSSPLSFVEEAILNALGDLMSNYKIMLKSENHIDHDITNLIENQLNESKKDLDQLEKQLNKIHTLYERDEYDTEQFMQRSALVNSQINEVKEKIRNIYELRSKEAGNDKNMSLIVPRLEHVLNVYDGLPTAEDKNRLLKDVITKVIYTKEKQGRYNNNNPRDFELKIYPRGLRTD